MSQNENSNEPSKSFIEVIVKYLNILLGYKKFIILTVIIGSSIVFIFLAISLFLPSDINPLPNKFQSNAVLLMQQDENDSLSALLSSMGSTTGLSPGFNYGQLALRITMWL